jgi:hypothetical protein
MAVKRVNDRLWRKACWKGSGHSRGWRHCGVGVLC